MEKSKIGKFFQLKFEFQRFFYKITGFFLKLCPRVTRCCPRAGPGSPTFEFAGTGGSFWKSLAGRGSGRPNVTVSSPLVEIESRAKRLLVSALAFLPCLLCGDKNPRT
jgi:hypothetical protein